jgi:predicted nuclease of predicted toxin-antitoxin system
VRLLIDECCDRLLAYTLRDGGLDVRYVAEDSPGLTDTEVLAAAEAEGRVLVTYDYDFGELAVRRSLAVPGVILIACGALSPRERADRAITALQTLSDAVEGWLTIVEPKRVRRRSLAR